MLDHCKAVALRAGLDPANFDLKTFRPTYATRMLRSGFDVRTVQHWMGHKSLETTMRYLVPAKDVNILDRESLMRASEGVDAVYHFAALVDPHRSRQEIQHTNVTGTREVWEYAAACGVKNALYGSSDAVYGLLDTAAATSSRSTFRVSGFGSNV